MLTRKRLATKEPNRDVHSVHVLLCHSLRDKQRHGTVRLQLGEPFRYPERQVVSRPTRRFQRLLCTGRLRWPIHESHAEPVGGAEIMEEASRW